MKRRYSVIAVLWILLFSVTGDAAFDSAEFSEKKPLEISRITPDGEDVPAGRQIVIQFNQPVVPLGRMERKAEEIPVSITPGIEGQWRWLNTSALAYQLDETHALKPSTRYTLVVHPGALSEDGKTLTENKVHSFITQRPDVSYYNFGSWKAPGHPVIRLTFNQPVTLNSVKKSMMMRFGPDGRTPSELLVSPDPNDYDKPCVIPVPGEPYALDFGPGKTVKSDDDPQAVLGDEARRIWLVEPQAEMPLDTGIELWVKPGLVSAMGPEKGVGNRLLMGFDTFPPFHFLGVDYDTHNQKDSVLISADVPGDKQTFKADPLSSVFLVFTSPVIPQEIKESVIFDPDLAGNRNDYDPWAGSYNYSYLRSAHRRGQVYRVRIPELLLANQKYILKESDINLKDEFGRLLDKPLEISFYTDHRKPDFELSHHIGVLEDAVPTDLPIVVTNIDKLKINYRTLTTHGEDQDKKITRTIPLAQDVAYFYPLGVRDMLGNQSGAVYGTLESQPFVEKYERENSFFAQVTPFQVLAKIGHFNSMVWVTDLSDGLSVKDAVVTVYKDRIDQLNDSKIILARALTDEDGAAVLPGNEILDPNLSVERWGWYQDDAVRLIVKVRKKDKMAILPISPDFEVDTWRVSNYSVSSNQSARYGHIHTWGTTPQGVYRAGDTISYKIYVRNQDNETFIAPPLKNYSLTVIDPMGKTVHELKNLELSKYGACDGTFTVAKNGAVGWYRFELSSDFTEETWSPMEVLVSDFTPSPFRVTSELSGDLYKSGDRVEISLLARLHAGGPYASAGTRVTARLEGSMFTSAHPLAKNFYFNTHSENSRSKTVFDEHGTLDEKGDLVSRFTLNEPDFIHGRLMVEGMVQDDRGKHVASMSSADYSGRTRLVGLISDKWVYEQGTPATFQFIVVNERGVPVSKVRTRLHAEHLVTKASRVKGAGNAYLTHYTHEWKSVHTKELNSKNKPGYYTFTPYDSGSYKIVAEITDTKGMSHSTEIHTWVTGKGQVVWEEPEGNSLEIIPEATDLKVGDTARCLIKNPYPGATAMVTLERYGVLKHWTQVLETGTPVIEFAVTPELLPGFFMSVTVVSPRVDKAQEPGEVDLGKPLFKTGYVEMTVKDPFKAIFVDVKPDKETYKPGDLVRVSIQTRVDNERSKEPVELAVAVLDEAVFDLLSDGRGHFDPYGGFYRVDGLDLMNYSLLTRLIGIQKFEKKGASPGGDGGVEISMRSVFDYVSYWNPSLATDKMGRADIEFKVPDNLTGWRVFAMAVTPTDRMGLGDKGFKVNKPTELRPVMPNQVTEGDSFKAGVTVMNRTDKVRTLDLVIRVEGPMDSEAMPPEMHQKISCPPFQRKTLFLPVKTRGTGELIFTVTAKDKKDGDGLIYHLPVMARRSLETSASYGTTTEKEINVPIRVPDQIYPDVGRISVVVSPSIIGNVAGAFSYMKNYPYSCWEQKLSRGVMAAHYLELKAYLPEDIVWGNARDCVLKTLEEAASFQSPSGAMTFYIPDDAYASPYLSAYTALALSWLKKSGYTIPASVESKLHSYLDDFLKRDVLPDFYSKGMAATVRAVALCALSENGGLHVDDLKRYESHVPQMSLFGKAMFMQAAMNTPKGDKLALSTCTLILAHSSQTGGKFMFSEEKDDSFTRILATPIRDNAAILSVLTAFGEQEEGRELVGDIPLKLVRAITQARANRDHWANTQENMFCMNALIDYARIYEKDKPDMLVKAFVDNVRIGKISFTDFKDEAGSFSRKISGEDQGKERLLTISRQGEGRLYYSPRMSYATVQDHAQRLNAGIDIRKEICVERDGKWLVLEKNARLSRGELVRVDIFVSLPSPRHFMVVDDPVPGGLEPVNRDLATASKFDGEKGDFIPAGGSWWFTFSDWLAYNAARWSFYHKELRHDSVRFYSDYLPAGNYHLSYTAQAIAEGDFTLMPVSAEEMYDPDVFGKGLPGTLTVTGNK
ncbi:MAG: large extracellular alpha-helical protein [Proteobacteria bacterium]|nr:large extracellular alpha-helical protein [Pseudomonadota bacterium]